jgi:hypothetical protein
MAYAQWGGQSNTMHKSPSNPLSRRRFLEFTAVTTTSLLTETGATAAPARFLGVTVMPEYIQTEGIDGILKNLKRIGATAVATSPYVMEEADEKTGSREPPADAGSGKVRLLDRPLWGKRELFVRTAPSYAPNLALYRGLRYQPSAPTALTKREGRIVGDFVKAAKAAGLKVYLQIQAAIPPGYRVQFGGPSEDDRARLPDGRIPPRRLANNGSLASPHIRAYHEALMRDLCAMYPSIDGIRPDWPEYPPYLLDDLFLDFSVYAQAAARRLGFNFHRMQSDAATCYRKLQGGLSDADLRRWLDDDGGRFQLLNWLRNYPGVADLLRFKAMMVDELLAGFRRAIPTGKELMPNAFPPPFSTMSGMDFARAARHSAALSVKLYTMHWPMMLRFYGDTLMKANPQLSEELLARVLVRWMDIADDDGLPRLSDYHYPEPEEAHPVGAQAQARKIKQAQALSGAVPVHAIAHGYGPLEDFRQRLEIANNASQQGIWLNRYAYLSEAKLDVIRQIFHR